MEFNRKDIIGIIMLIIMPIVSATQPWPIIIIVGIVLFIAYGLNFLYEKRIISQSMSNSSVFKASKKHCKTLYKFAKVSSKEFSKLPKVKKYIREKNSEKEILNRIIKNKSKNNIIARHRLKKLNKSYESLKTKFDNKSALQIVKNLSVEKEQKICDFLSVEFNKLDRVLLNAEQYNLRIKFGEFLKFFGNTMEVRMKASIDNISWTYAMMGLDKKLRNELDFAINSIEEYLKDKNVEEKENQILLLLLCKAYRHFGSAKTIVTRNPDLAIDKLRIGMNKLVDYTIDLEKKESMRVGFEYGILYATYIKVEKDIRVNSNIKIIYDSIERIDQLIHDTEGFINKHRHVKFHLLRNAYNELLVNHQVYENNHGRCKLLERLSCGIETVNQIFDNNIFTDEAIEIMLSQQIFLMKHKLINLFDESIRCKELY